MSTLCSMAVISFVDQVPCDTSLEVLVKPQLIAKYQLMYHCSNIVKYQKPIHCIDTRI